MPVDDSFSKALLHMNGADASTTFTDESGKVWTANGNAQIDTAQSKFGGASGLFDGTGDFVDTPDHADWQLDGGSNSNKWTIDFWVRFNGDPGAGFRGFLRQHVDNNNRWTLHLGNNELRFIVVSASTTIVSIANAWNPADATWYHIAVVKDGVNGYMMFVDGIQIGTTQTDISTIPDFAVALEMGRSGTSPDYHNGWIEELRISKGVARWTANFTPPTTQYSNGQAVGGEIVPTGNPTKLISKFFSGGISPSGILAAARLFFRTLAGSIAPIGALVKQTGKILSGAITPIGGLIRNFLRRIMVRLSKSPTADILVMKDPTGDVRVNKSPTGDVEVGR